MFAFKKRTVSIFIENKMIVNNFLAIQTFIKMLTEQWHLKVGESLKVYLTVRIQYLVKMEVVESLLCVTAYTGIKF